MVSVKTVDYHPYSISFHSVTQDLVAKMPLVYGVLEWKKFWNAFLKKFRRTIFFL